MALKTRRNNRIWIFILCIIIAGPACSAINPDTNPDTKADTKADTPGRTVSFSQIHKSLDQNRSAYVSKTLAVIEKRRDFAKLFTALSGGNKKVPEIDFTRHMVLLAHMGTRKSTGYSIEIENISAFDNYMRVQVVSRVPGKKCMTGAAMTHPYHLVRIPKTDKDIIFSEKLIMKNCQ